MITSQSMFCNSLCILLLSYFVFFCSLADIAANNKEGHRRSLPKIKKATGSAVEDSHCGRHIRNQNLAKIISGKKYDSLVPLGDGLDGKVEHAYSLSLGRCVAIKTCAEDPARLNKCTRELEVLQKMQNAKYIVKLLDFEIKRNQPCTEGALMSDYIRTILLGNERKRRRKRRIAPKNGGANGTKSDCNQIVFVEELGTKDAEHYWKEMKAKKKTQQIGEGGPSSMEQIKAQIQKGLDELHGNGIAHRDMHKDNAMLFPPLNSTSNSTELTVKIIDMGWACCFNAQKCGQKVAKVLPKCGQKEAIADDQFSLQDVFEELDAL